MSNKVSTDSAGVFSSVESSFSRLSIRSSRINEDGCGFDMILDLTRIQSFLKSSDNDKYADNNHKFTYSERLNASISFQGLHFGHIMAGYFKMTAHNAILVYFAAHNGPIMAIWPYIEQLLKSTINPSSQIKSRVHHNSKRINLAALKSLSTILEVGSIFDY